MEALRPLSPSGFEIRQVAARLELSWGNFPPAASGPIRVLPEATGPNSRSCAQPGMAGCQTAAMEPRMSVSYP